MKGSRKILIVDSDRASCELLKKTLEKEGYEVDTASDGVEALNRNHGGSLPNLMITDVVLPGMDGLQLIETFKAYDDTRDIKVIICSMKTSLEDIKKGLAAGADQYVTKPFEPVKIVETVRRVLGDEKAEYEFKTKTGYEEKDSTEESWMDFGRRVVQVGEEKRRCPRLEFHCPVRIQGVKEVKRVTDIGIGGIFVRSEVPPALKMGQAIYLSMKLPTEREPVKVKAKVANVRDRGIGFRFVDLTPTNQEIIRCCFNTFKDTIPLR